MSAGSTTLPFPLKGLAPEEVPHRAAIARAFPGIEANVSLPNLAGLLGTAEVSVHMAGIERKPKTLPPDVVPLATTTRQEVDSPKMCLGLSLPLATLLVQRTLGRTDAPQETKTAASEAGIPLTAGEQGVLLFALDTAGSDWIRSGGGEFVVRSILEDAEQMKDYLGESPTWQVSTEIEVDGHPHDAWLWWNDPPSALRSRKKPHGGKTGGWEIDLGVCVGLSRIPAAALQELSEGDGVILDSWSHPMFGESGSCPALISGSWRRFGRWLDNRRIKVITVRERERDMESKQPNTAPLHAALTPSSGGDAKELEVLIRVEVGEIRLTVDDAQGLVPGRVLVLNRDVGPEVALRVGDRIVARGALVEYQGSLAVEIKEIS